VTQAAPTLSLQLGVVEIIITASMVVLDTTLPTSLSFVTDQRQDHRQERRPARQQDLHIKQFLQIITGRPYIQMVNQRVRAQLLQGLDMISVREL
jgi:hypothetical protein